MHINSHLETMESIPKGIVLLYKFLVVFRYRHCSQFPWELQISKKICRINLCVTSFTHTTYTWVFFQFSLFPFALHPLHLFRGQMSSPCQVWEQGLFLLPFMSLGRITLEKFNEKLPLLSFCARADKGWTEFTLPSTQGENCPTYSRRCIET